MSEQRTSEQRCPQGGGAPCAWEGSPAQCAICGRFRALVQRPTEAKHLRTTAPDGCSLDTARAQVEQESSKTPPTFWLCSCRHANTPVYYADEIDKLRENRDYHWEQINRLARAIGMLGCKTEDVVSEAIHMLRGCDIGEGMTDSTPLPTGIRPAPYSPREKKTVAEIERLRALLTRVYEWTPAFPVEAGLLDEIGVALGYVPNEWCAEHEIVAGCPGFIEAEYRRLRADNARLRERLLDMDYADDCEQCQVNSRHERAALRGDPPRGTVQPDETSDD
jgi:hypothetical protein